MSNEIQGVRVAKEAHAYTPGLKIKKAMKIRKVRRLPVPGRVLVDVGDKVNFLEPIAETTIPGDPYVISAAAELGIERGSLLSYMVKSEGDKIKKGENLAGFNAFFGLWKKWVESPIDGYVETISEVSGQIIVREEPVSISVNAYIPGEIVEVLENEGAVVETNGAFVQGIFGIGGEAHGEIKIISDDPEAKITADHLTTDSKGKVVVGGSIFTDEALLEAVEVGVAGIVTGGIRDVDLEGLLGYEIGVAITGQEEAGLTLIITEGFGRMRMSKQTFDLLRGFEGYMASVNGATQIRAGVMRPEIIVPHEEGFEQASGEELSAGMVPGTPVRIIRKPYFGAIGKVVSLPVELQQVESESYVRVLEVELDDGRVVTIPRANVEIIEE